MKGTLLSLANYFHIPIMNPTNDILLGVFSIGFQVLIFLDAVFEDKKKRKYKKKLHNKGSTNGLKVVDPSGTNYLIYPKDSGENLVDLLGDDDFLLYSDYWNNNMEESSVSERNIYVDTTTRKTSYEELLSGQQSKPEVELSNSYANGNSHFKDKTQKMSSVDDINSHFQKYGHEDNIEKYDRYDDDDNNHGFDNYDTIHGYYDEEDINGYSSSRSKRDYGPKVEEKSQGKRKINPDFSQRNYPRHSDGQKRIEFGAFRSITEDQFSVYTQVAGLFATAGMGGASCLQYIICILAHKQNGGQWAQDGGNWIQDGGQRAQDDGQWAQFDGHGAQNGSQWIKKGGHAIDGETTQNGGQSVQDGEGPVKSKTKKASEKKEENLKESSSSNKKQKKTRRTSSLISDLASTLLLPKAGHSDSLYTEAAQAALAGGGSCEQRYTGCSAAVKGVIDTLLRL